MYFRVQGIAQKVRTGAHPRTRTMRTRAEESTTNMATTSTRAKKLTGRRAFSGTFATSTVALLAHQQTCSLLLVGLLLYKNFINGVVGVEARTAARGDAPGGEAAQRQYENEQTSTSNIMRSYMITHLA